MSWSQTHIWWLKIGRDISAVEVVLDEQGQAGKETAGPAALDLVAREWPGCGVWGRLPPPVTFTLSICLQATF